MDGGAWWVTDQTQLSDFHLGAQLFSLKGTIMMVEFLRMYLLGLCCGMQDLWL